MAVLVKQISKINKAILVNRNDLRAKIFFKKLACRVSELVIKKEVRYCPIITTVPPAIAASQDARLMVAGKTSKIVIIEIIYPKQFH